jgi:apolipoprotein N-acyltransferase
MALNMSDSPHTTADPVPLIVDLDGTLLRTDMMFESLARLLRRNPLALFAILFWWTRGRAFLKQQLARRVEIDPATLPYNEKFLTWLRAEKKAGRKLILATASDLKMAQPVADYVGLFDEVLASDGKTNLRSENKLRALTEKFGPRGFDYAGNSSADYAVWRGAREAVVVNASRGVLREAANCTKLGPTYCDTYSPVAVAGRFYGELLWRSGYLAAAGAGLLLATAFPDFNCAGFAWVAPALLLAAARGQGVADAFRVGYVGGLFFWLASLSWLLRIPVAGFPILGWLSLAAFLALFNGVWVWAVSNFKFQISNFNTWRRRTVWALLGAATWVALEMLRARIFGGFPWNLLATSQFKLVPLIQLASVTGIYGISFLVVWFSLALFSAAQMILRNPSRRFVWQAEIILPLTVTIFIFVAGFFSLNRDVAAEQFERVTIIQPSVPQTMIWSAADDAKRFQDLLRQSQAALDVANGERKIEISLTPANREPAAGLRAGKPDLLLWPESAVPDIDDKVYRAIQQFAQSNRVWIILNGDDVEFHPDATNAFNSALLFRPDGQLAQIYHKRQLVIFGEYIPLVRWLPFIKWFTPITGGWTAGDKAATFDLGRCKTSPLICYEDSFPGVVREAAADDIDFLVNLTNDGWFGHGAAQWQQAAAAVFRSVENGVPLVRCANNGVSCLIDAHGRVVKILTDERGDDHGRGALTVDIPLLAPAEKGAATFYHRHGEWFGWSCVGLAVFGLFFRKQF